MDSHDAFACQTYSIADILRIPMHDCPKYATLTAILNILDGLAPTAAMLATARFIDSAVALFQHGGEWTGLILPISLVVLCMAYTWLSPPWSELANTKMENALRESFRLSLVKKVASLEYPYIEQEESWNLISRVLREPETQCTKAYGQFFNAIDLILKIVGIMIVLFTQVWWTAPLIALIAIPVFRVAAKGGEERYEANREAEKYNRRAIYLSEVLSGRDAAEERELFQYHGKINDMWHSQYETARKIKRKASLKWWRQSETGGILTSLFTAGVILILVFPVKTGNLSIGLFISIINNVVTLIPDLAWQLPESTEAIAEDREYLADLTSLVRLRGKEEYLGLPDENSEVIEKIEFQDVTFRYPGTERDVLNHLSFCMERGKTYAIVGANGAGKTTVTKLLTGLYEDFEGDIRINGISIRKYEHSRLKAMFAVVYQDFARYAVSLKENVAIGKVNGCSIGEIQKALDTIGLGGMERTLPKGLDSTLGRIDAESVDLSGGQWQRVAMARVLVSPASFRILDEPTAALDPISESKLYEEFGKISHGKTTMLISHRLGSTKLADRIFVMEDGTVAEQGDYAELMDRNRIYAKMFESQRDWYVRKKQER